MTMDTIDHTKEPRFVTVYCDPKCTIKTSLEELRQTTERIPVLLADLLKDVEYERDSWWGENADLYWQTNRIVGRIQQTQREVRDILARRTVATTE